MMIKEKIEFLQNEKNTPCVTISMNTHRKHPENKQDAILLKNLCKEAEKRLLDAYEKDMVGTLIDRLSSVQKEIDSNYNLDSLHLFLSAETKEVVRLGWSTIADKVHIGASFAVKPLIKAYNRSEDYLILLLSQSGVQLFEALNDSIVEEILDKDFPFEENPHYVADTNHRSDAKKMDNMVREYFNKVDKAVIEIYNATKFNVVVICTEDNYSRLQQVANRPDIYYGYSNINYNAVARHQLAEQSWEIVRKLQDERKAEAILEMKEAVGQGKVITDLKEIFRAAKEGRGDLLIAYNKYTQPVHIIDESETETIDDVISSIAAEVLDKNGRTFFTTNKEILDLGEIALKVRY